MDPILKWTGGKRWLAKALAAELPDGKGGFVANASKNWSDIEVVVGGWRPGRGTRAGTIGSLLVGLPEETGLRYVGRVGTGFTDAALKSLAAELKPLTISRSPFLDKIDAPVLYLDGPDYEKYVGTVYKKETMLIERLKLRELTRS